MMTTSQTVLNKINQYLNHDIDLAHLVDWAETTLIEPNIPDDEDADAIMNVLMYLGAADTRGFPLTWNILTEFIEQLGGTVRVILEPA